MREEAIQKAVEHANKQEWDLLQEAKAELNDEEFNEYLRRVFHC